MHQNNFKKHVNDKLFSSEKIAIIEKPSRECGSTTLLLDYFFKRMIYEEDYNILIVSRDLHRERHLLNTIRSYEHWNCLVIDKTMICNPEVNNKIFFRTYRNLESSVRGLQLNEILLQDAPVNKISDELTQVLLCTVLTRKGRILVEEEVHH